MNNELKIEKENDILTITLNRPERRNALSKSMLEKLLEVLLEAYNNPTLRALILTGSEEAFCAGGDVKDMAKEDYTNSSLITRYKTIIKDQTLSKVTVVTDEKRSRAELLDMVEELFETDELSYNSSFAEKLRALLHIIIKSTNNSIDDN